MQKLPEFPGRKRGDACTKKEPSRSKKETRSLSAVTGEVTTLKSFLLLVGGPTRPSLGGALAIVSLVAADSVNIQPKYKKFQMDLLNYELKTPNFDKSPLKRPTHC